MKAGTQNHLKTKRLMRLLGIPLYRAVGLLETLWLLCTDCCDEGNIGKFTDEEIADYLGWDGKQSPSQLMLALVECGWLDETESDRFAIHDWQDHAPEYLKERWQKRAWRAKKRCKSTTYDESTPDTGGQQPDCPGTVRSIPNPTQPIQTQPNQAQPNPAADAAGSTNPPANGSAAKGRRPPHADVPLPPALASDPFPAAWSDWLAYRRERRLTLRDRTIRAQLESLAPLGPVAAAECVRASIRNGWQGIFPDTKGGRDGQRSRGQRCHD